MEITHKESAEGKRMKGKLVGRVLNFYNLAFEGEDYKLCVVCSEIYPLNEDSMHTVWTHWNCEERICEIWT
jgi:hypothetical protein